MVEFVATMSRHRGGPVLVGGVADRSARVLGRVGQSGGQRQGTAIAPPKRAARPPVRPARVAEANRQTIGLGVGLSSQWSPAESGSIPERLSSVRTYAGARDYLVYQYRTCPASRSFCHGPVSRSVRVIRMSGFSTSWNRESHSGAILVITGVLHSTSSPLPDFYRFGSRNTAFPCENMRRYESLCKWVRLC